MDMKKTVCAVLLAVMMLCACGKEENGSSSAKPAESSQTVSSEVQSSQENSEKQESSKKEGSKKQESSKKEESKKQETSKKQESKAGSKKPESKPESSAVSKAEESSAPESSQEPSAEPSVQEEASVQQPESSVEPVVSEPESSEPAEIVQESVKPAEESKTQESVKPAEESKQQESKKPAEESKKQESKKPAEESKKQESKKPAEESKKQESKKPAEESKQQEKPEPKPEKKPAAASGERVGASWFDDAVFVGDSVTLKLSYYAEDYGALGKAEFLCAGSLGYTNGLWDLNAPDNVHPFYNGVKYTIPEGLKAIGAKKIFIMLGMNDIGCYGVDGSLESMKTMTSKIEEKCPDADIYVESVTPMLENMQLTGLNNRTIAEFDEKVKAVCAQRGYKYMDVASAVDDGNGNLVYSYCGDPTAMGLHFSDAGCDQWVEYLKCHVNDAQ